MKVVVDASDEPGGLNTVSVEFWLHFIDPDEEPLRFVDDQWHYEWEGLGLNLLGYYKLRAVAKDGAGNQAEDVVGIYITAIKKPWQNDI